MPNICFCTGEEENKDRKVSGLLAVKRIHLTLYFFKQFQNSHTMSRTENIFEPLRK